MKHFLPPLFLSLMTFSMQVYTQQLYERLPYDNIWMLGNDISNIRIDFSTSPPIVDLVNTPIDFSSTNASICRADGSLLMYSNGFRVLNGGHQYLENGFRINEQYDYPEDWLQTGNRLFQGMLILPQATDTNIYHLFYTEPVYFFNEDGQLAVSANNIYYAEANFLENQQGVIIDKDFLIVSDTLDFGKITACRHGNGRDWWVFAVNLDANQYHRILVTDQGVEDYGITSDGSAMRPTLGQVHFTPDGKRLVNAGLAEISEHDITVYDFDRCTGELTNANTTTFISDSITITGGMAISENSRFVYTTEQYHVYQYDLNAADVWSSRTLIEIWDGYYNGDHPGFFWANFGRAQLAPDGKIYVSTPGSGRQYHIIHNPNKRGAASKFEQRGLAFTRWNNRSIPNFPYYGLGPWDGSPCDTLNIDNPIPEARYEHSQDSSALQLEFFDASYYAYEWSWDFGDGSATNTEQHPVHTFPTSGTYQVCLQVSNVTGQDVYCEEIYVGVVATANPMSENLRVQVYPNPTQGDLSLIGGDISLVEKISLLDINGKRVTEWSGEIQHGLKLPAELVDGVYLLRIQEIDGILQTIKIIISN